MKKINLIICCVILIVVVIVSYLMFRPTESFQITSGMITPQRRFYGQCIDDCWRNFTGDSSEGQFNWLCTDNCAKKAALRAEVGLPDITEEQHERHNPVNIINPLKIYEREKIDSRGSNEPLRTSPIDSRISAIDSLLKQSSNKTFCPGRAQDDPPYYLTEKTTNNMMWRPGIYGANECTTFKECYCKGEIEDWCKHIYCPHSSNMKQCYIDCKRMRSVNCRAGLDWSWKP
jgi:hypothetical protein